MTNLFDVKLRPMEEQAVRLAAYAHIQAIAANDLEAALAYVVSSERPHARTNLAAVIDTVLAAEPEEVEVEGDEAVVTFLVRTSDPESSQVRLETIWREMSDGPRLQIGYRVS